MKPIKSLLLALALTCAVVAPVTFTGCAVTRTTEAVVFDSFKTTYNASYSAYTSWLELVVKGKVSKADEARVDKAWNDFRDAFSIAFQTASQNWSAATPEQVQRLADNLITLIRKL